MIGFEENEISEKANGGTEIAKRTLAKLIDPDLLSNFQIICSRHRDFNPEKIRLFWCHDLPQDPESAKFRDDNFKNSIHKFVFISNWQYQQYLLVHGLPYDTKSIILESGITPTSPSCLTDKDPEKIRLVYTSTPQRGLEILIPVFEILAKKYPNIHLDVFSSFKIYGWDDYDKQFEPLYEKIRNHPQMTYHGFVPNEQLRDHLNKCHIFAYPSIWPETSCRAMLEAMSAGLVCVHPNFAALPETSGLLNVMYHGDYADKSEHAAIFHAHLEMAVNFIGTERYKNAINFNKVYVDGRYNIDYIKAQWENMLKILLKKYPTVESRALVSKSDEMFTYRAL